MAAGSEQVDRAFAGWERLRRRLYERECEWARTVTLTGDPQRLGPIREEVARLETETDRALRSALAELQTATRSARHPAAH